MDEIGKGEHEQLAVRPEVSEPPTYALASIVRALGKVLLREEREWLVVFSDLVDKARQLQSSAALQTVAAAATAAPAQFRATADHEVRSLEKLVAKKERVAPQAWTQSAPGASILLVVPKRAELEAAISAFELASLRVERFKSHMRFRQRELSGALLPQGGRLTVVCLEEAGGLPASFAVRDYQDAFGRPELAILAGMAMGILALPTGGGEVQKRNAELGDVVVAQSVYDYNPRRVTKEGVEPRFETYRIASELFYDVSEHLENVTGFQAALSQSTTRLIDERRLVPPDGFPDPWHPSIYLRGILAGADLVEDESGPERAKLHDRIAALEMEGGGFAGTCEHVGVPWLVVRGIADYGTPDRDKRWQVFAAAAAMCFARTFIESEFEPVSR